MTRFQKGKQAIQRVVAYCRVREQIAAARNERFLVLHWQSVQMVVMEAFYGAEPPLHRFRQSARPAELPQPKPQTTYQLEVMRQPRRRVVKQITVNQYDSHLRREITIYQDQLACGHVLHAFTGRYEGTMVRYRRCNQCPQQNTYRRPDEKRRAS